jgi:4-amino-4-deoxy-L-arabinose transferase-like glycosyltransferase
MAVRGDEATDDADARTRFAWSLAAIAAVGFLLRMAYALTRSDFTGLTDPRYYHLQANLIADGHGYADPNTWLLGGGYLPTATHPPLFPTLLSAVSALGGTSHEAHRVVACVLGTATVVLIGLLGARLGGRVVGLVAAGIAAVYPNLWILDTGLFSESLVMLLVTGLLLLAYGVREHPTTFGAVAMGVLIALTALTRGEGVLFLPLLAAPLFLLLGSLSWGRRFGLLGVAALSFLVVMAPWSYRNLTGFERPILFSTADTVLGVSNCDLTYGGDLIGWWTPRCSRERSLREDPSIHAQIMRDKAFDYIDAHRGRLVTVVAPVRLARLFDVYRPFQTAELEVPEGRPLTPSKAGVVMYWLLVPFAVGGAVVMLRRRLEPLWPLLVPPVISIAVALYSYGNPRFRAISEPIIVVLAALGAVALVHAFTRKRAPVVAAS